MTFYEIICPKCFQRFGPNNVVFRRLSQGEGEEPAVDPYIYHHEFQRGNPGYAAPSFGYVDPAYLTPSKRIYHNRLLTGVIDDGAGALRLPRGFAPIATHRSMRVPGVRKPMW